MKAAPVRVALVTGANRGLGLEISRQLAKKGVRVIVSARDGAKAREAAESLSRQGLDCHPLKLDVTDAASIQEARASVEKQFGRLDILVNNAGIFLDQEGHALDIPLETVRKTFETNVLGALAVSQAFVPLMQAGGYGRIVNLSSGLGSLSEMEGGYPSYRLSKTSLNALTRILAAELKGTLLLVNSMCPGWCRTDMGGAGANRSVEEGADTAVYLAFLPDKGPTGKYFRDRREIAW